MTTRMSSTLRPSRKIRFIFLKNWIKIFYEIKIKLRLESWFKRKGWFTSWPYQCFTKKSSTDAPSGNCFYFINYFYLAEIQIFHEFVFLGGLYVGCKYHAGQPPGGTFRNYLWDSSGKSYHMAHMIWVLVINSLWFYLYFLGKFGKNLEIESLRFGHWILGKRKGYSTLLERKKFVFFSAVLSVKWAP